MSREFVFVSHVSEDRRTAMDIVAALEGSGLVCWIAPRNVQPGNPFDDEIANAIESCVAMVLIFSEHCNDSDYIRREVTFAGEAGKRIIPVRIEDTQPRKGLRIRLADLHWVDAFPSTDSAISEVLLTIRPPPPLAEPDTMHRPAPVSEPRPPPKIEPVPAHPEPAAPQVMEQNGFSPSIVSPPPVTAHQAFAAPVVPTPEAATGTREDKARADAVVRKIRQRVVLLFLLMVPATYLVAIAFAVVADAIGIRPQAQRGLVLVFSLMLIAAVPVAGFLLRFLSRLRFFTLREEIEATGTPASLRDKVVQMNQSGVLRFLCRVDIEAGRGITYRVSVILPIAFLIVLMVVLLVIG